MATDERWKHDGVRVIPGTELDPNTPQDAGDGPQGRHHLRPRVDVVLSLIHPSYVSRAQGKSMPSSTEEEADC